MYCRVGYNITLHTVHNTMIVRNYSGFYTTEDEIIYLYYFPDYFNEPRVCSYKTINNRNSEINIKKYNYLQ